MTLRPARKLPERQQTGGCLRKSYVEHDVREFLRTGMQVAVVEAKGHEAKYVVVALRNYIKKHPDTCAEIGCALRGGSRISTERKGARWPS